MPELTSTQRKERDRLVKELYELYQNDWTQEAIGKRYGMTRANVSRLFKLYSLPVRDHATTSRRRKEKKVQEMVDSGLAQRILDEYARSPNMDTVAKRLHLSRPTIALIIDELAESKKRRGSYPKKYSDQEIIDCLREAATTTHGTKAAYQSYARNKRLPDGRPFPGVQTALLRFGGWNNALRAAGIAPGRSTGVRIRYTEDNCLAALRRVAREVDFVPAVIDYDAYRRPEEPSAATVRHRFGSWTNALEAAGL